MEVPPPLLYDAAIQAAAHSQSHVGADHTQQHARAAPHAPRPQNQNQQHQRRPKNNHNQQHQQQNQGKKQRRARNFKQQPRAVDMPRVLSELLSEPKQALLRRVVRIVGPKLAWELLKETMHMQQQGGMEVNAFGSGAPDKFLVEDKATQEKKPRKRTTGGVYFTLLRDKVSKETYRDIYEIENKKKKEVKKHVRYQKKQKFESELSQLGFDDLNVQMNGANAADNETREESGSITTAASVYPFTVPSSSVWASSSSHAVGGGAAPESAHLEMHRSGDDDEHEDGEVDEAMTLV